MTDIDKKREKIKVGLKSLRLGARPDPDGVNRPSFLSPDDVNKIWNYLHENDVVIKVNLDRLPSIGDAKLAGVKSNGLIYVAVEPLIDEVICDDLPSGKFPPIENPDFEQTDKW